jgi:dTDP-4-dehydrorhamnose reductase
VTNDKPIAILQFGATGQVARAVMAAADDSKFRVTALGRDQVDFREPAQLEQAMALAEGVDIVVNAAAYTAVDKAESEEAIARLINATSVGVLARACAARGVPLIHLSTDYVFAGTGSAPQDERTPVAPLGAYGRTKLEGEETVRAASPRHVVLRTSWVYGAEGTNFVRTMLRLGSEKRELRIVDDQHGAPTSAASIAAAILSIAQRIARAPPLECFGTFHYADRGETTWRRFAEAIFAAAGLDVRVVPITTAEYPTPAQRPLNSRLDCAKIERVFNIVRRPWHESLLRVLEENGENGTGFA